MSGTNSSLQQTTSTGSYSEYVTLHKKNNNMFKNSMTHASVRGKSEQCKYKSPIQRNPLDKYWYLSFEN